MIHRVKDFGAVNKAEVNIFLELSCFFYDPTNVGNLISGSSAFSKSILDIWKFMVHVLLKPGMLQSMGSQRVRHRLVTGQPLRECKMKKAG